MQHPDMMGVTSPVRDMGVNREVRNDVDDDATDHRHSSQYIGLRLPKRPKRPSRGNRRSREKRDKVPAIEDASPAALSPSEHVQFLLGETEEGEEHEPHSVFCQMDQLHKLGGELEWREAARWVKYEEDVEEGGERWSKPHVASLSLHSLFELRSSLLSGCVVLDMDAYHITNVTDLLLDNLINKQLLEESMRDTIRTVLISPHRHQHQKRRRSSIRPGVGDHSSNPGSSMLRTLSEIGRRFSEHNTNKMRADMQAVAEKYNREHGGSPLLKRNPHSSPNMEQPNGGIPESASSANLKLNQNFMRKIPDGAEVANIMVGEVETLKYQVCAFVRLSEARIIGDMSEVPIPTRFLFFLLGPTGTMTKMVEIGRSISTIMVDQVFREVAYRARKRQDILAGIDEFLDQVTVLPPGEWDPNIRIEPPANVPSQEARKIAPKPDAADAGEEEEEIVSHCDPTLQRSGRLFGGLIDDIKRKIPWYPSDFKDCLHIQCFASVIYLFLATLTPNVTFGGLLGLATHNYMGTMECILSAAITGVLFALFAGQPLNILGSTGPMLVLEMILYNFCSEYELDFLPFRVWIGLWTTLILLLIVAFDLSALVRYITRFTEESFACLIAIIFIVEAFKKLYGIKDKYPINFNPGHPLNYECDCIPGFNETNGTFSPFHDMYSLNGSRRARAAVEPMEEKTDISKYLFNGSVDYSLVNWTTISKAECLGVNASLIGEGCGTPEYKDNIFYLSILFFTMTFVLAYGLTHFKQTRFFPTFVRQSLSDFAVLIAIVITVGFDVWVGLPTPKLMVPEKFAPSNPNRGWFINPMSDKNPWWLILAAVLPALLATILIFMDQQITAVIVNRKENRLKKGNGYHLDLLVVAVCIAICSILGLPWYVAATVSAIAHIMSLKKESECNAPGEKPVFLGVREQRVTALLVGILSGCSVLFTSVLRIIPMPVLYGVFFYMGVAALKGMQFVDRLFLIAMPAKYQPDTTYLRHVPIGRVHLFTLVQVICLICLWLIKSFKAVSIVFPIMVLGTCFVRKAMDYLFTQRELKHLDDIMPEVSKRAKEDANKEDEHEDEELLKDEEHMMGIRDDYLKPRDKFSSARRGSVDTDRVNISEEMSKTAIWLSVRKDSQPQFENPSPKDGSPSKTKKKKKSKKEKEVEEDSPPAYDEDSSHNSTDQPSKGMFFIPGEEPAEVMREIPEETEDADESKV